MIQTYAVLVCFYLKRFIFKVYSFMNTCSTDILVVISS